MLSTVQKTPLNFSRESLHGYQNRAVEFICDTPRAALWIDLGLGKTVTVLTAIVDLLERFETSCVLIIAPKRVAQTTWPDEIRRWDHTRHLEFGIIKGTIHERDKFLVEDGSPIHIINRELVPWLANALGKNWFYDMVVIDEASSFKSPKAQRFKALRRVLPKIDRLVEMTGTPASNGLLDIWSQLYLIDHGERLGKTFTGYRKRYFESDYHGFKWWIKKDADKEIHRAVDDVCLTLRAEDYLELPERIETVIDVTLPERVVPQYRQLEQHCLVELENETIKVLSAAALTNKLLQFANGALYLDGGDAWTPVHAAKLDALEDLVAEAVGQPLLVAYNYRSDLARLKERFDFAETLGDDPETIERWNRGEIPMLLAHPASAGHGLNLQHGGHHIVWFGLNWSLELNQQFNARLHRQGQTKPVIVTYLAVKNSVDQTVLRALQLKDRTQSALLNALKEDMKGRQHRA